MISFNNINIEGYGSIVKPLSYNLDRQGLNIIRGENGEGKTTLFSAFSWCITGKPLKENASVESWVKVRDNDYRGTMVSVSFKNGDSEFEVIRCLNFGGVIYGAKGKDRLILLENGAESKSKGKKDIQQEINQVLGVSTDLFRASIIFGQNMKRFIEEDGPTKKKLLEEAFNITWINQAKALSDEYLSDNMAKLNKIKPNISFLQSKIENCEELLEDFDNQKNKWEDNKTEEIDWIHVQLDNLTNSVPNLKEYPEEWFKKIMKLRGKLPDQIAIWKRDKAMKESLNRDIIDMQFNLGKVETMLQGIQRSKASASSEHAHCPVCNSKLTTLTKENAVAHYQSEENKLHNTIDKYKNDIIQAKLDASSLTFNAELLNSFAAKISMLETAYNEARSQNSRIRESLNQKISLEKSLEALLKQEFSLDKTKLVESLNNATEEIKPLKAQFNKFQKNISIYSWMSKNVFSNTGIKAFIIDTMLDKLNENLRNYSSRIGFYPEFAIDLESGRKDISLFIYYDEDVVSYNDLSGGQKQLVNVAIAFAIHDLVSANTHFNLLIMDEVFENLSSKSIDLVSELIQEKAVGQSLFLITHHQDFNPINANTWDVVSEKGVTKFL